MVGVKSINLTLRNTVMPLDILGDRTPSRLFYSGLVMFESLLARKHFMNIESVAKFLIPLDREAHAPQLLPREINMERQF
jgi:hypothetical protein